MTDFEEIMRPTHTVTAGKLRHNVYLDGINARDIVTGRVVATQGKDGRWSKPVREIRYKPGPGDAIRPVGPAVQVQVDKGRFY